MHVSQLLPYRFTVVSTTFYYRDLAVSSYTAVTFTFSSTLQVVTSTSHLTIMVVSTQSTAVPLTYLVSRKVLEQVSSAVTLDFSVSAVTFLPKVLVPLSVASSGYSGGSSDIVFSSSVGLLECCFFGFVLSVVSFLVASNAGLRVSPPVRTVYLAVSRLGCVFYRTIIGGGISALKFGFLFTGTV